MNAKQAISARPRREHGTLSLRCRISKNRNANTFRFPAYIRASLVTSVEVGLEASDDAGDLLNATGLAALVKADGAGLGVVSGMRAAAFSGGSEAIYKQFY